MPGNAFIKFSGVDKGESLQKTHPGSSGWIEIGDWNWDIESETSFMKGGGSSVGKATPGSFGFSHFWDLSSAKLLSLIVSGRHFDWVVVEMLKQTGENLPQVYFQIKMASAFVTKVTTKAGEDGTLDQDVEMVCKEIVVSYKAQTNKGALESTAIPFNWNISKNNLTTEIKGSL